MAIQGSFLVIQDYMTGNEGAGSALFDGSPIYVYCNKISRSFKNNISTQTKIMQDVSLDNDNNNIGSHWERRKGYTQYNSFEPPVFTANCTWTTDVGSIQSIGSILTPYKLMRMEISGHQFFIRGTRLIDNMLKNDADTTGSFYVSTKGIPVTIESTDSSAEAKEENPIRFTIVFREDR